MSDVKAKLREATCEAAPYGWRPTTLGDREIIEFYDDEFGGFVGIVRTENCGLAAVQWDVCGVDDDDNGGPWNLVPLPAPEPERLTDNDLACAVETFRPGTAGQIMARELQQARKTIADLKAAEIEWQKLDAMRRDKIAEQAAEIERLTRERDSERCHNEDEEANQQEKSATIRRQSEIIERLTRERDAAIELAGRLRNEIAFYGPAAGGLCAEFDQRYGDQPAPPQTCEHEWCHTMGEPGKVTQLCTKCGDISECPPTCDPLPPANESIEYLRSTSYPGLLFGGIVSTGGKFECTRILIDPACVESGPWEGQSGGVWRAM